MQTGTLGPVEDNPNSSFSRPFILTSISLILASGRFSVKVKFKEISFSTVVDDSLSAIMFRFEKKQCKQSTLPARNRKREISWNFSLFGNFGKKF